MGLTPLSPCDTSTRGRGVLASGGCSVAPLSSPWNHGLGGHGVPSVAQQQESCAQLHSPPSFVSSSPAANTSLSPHS